MNQLSALNPQPLTGHAADMANCIAAAQHIIDLKPIKDVIKISDNFTDVEKTLLLTLAEERADSIGQAYTASQIYRPGRYAGD